MRTHFYKFIFIVISLCTLATTNAWANKIVYLDVTNAPFNADLEYTTNMYIHYWVPGSDTKKYYQLVPKDDYQMINGRMVYRIELGDNANTSDEWWWRVCRKNDNGSYYHYHKEMKYNQYNWYRIQNKMWVYDESNDSGTSAQDKDGIAYRTPGLLTGGHIYFDNARTKWTGVIQFVVGHGREMHTYTLTKIADTELYYLNLTEALSNRGDSWGISHTYYSFIANTSAWADTLSLHPEGVRQSGKGYSENYRRQGELLDGKVYFMRPKYENGQWLFDIYQEARQYTIYQRAMIRPTDGSYVAVADNVTYPANVNIWLVDTIKNLTQIVSKTYNSGTNKNYNPRVLIAGKIAHTYNSLNSAAYTFDGWGSEPSTDGIPTLTAPSTANEGLTHYISENTTVCAFFTAKSFKVTLNNQSATDSGTESVNPSYGYAMPTITLPTRTGYTFGGYYTETNGAGTQYYKADGTSAKNYDLTSTLTLYAKWTKNTYTVTLDNQGATSAGTTSVTATYDETMTEITPPTRTGYTFGGYYTEINGNGKQYYHGTGTGARNWDIASATTLYAYWKPNTCTLIFNMNGGVGEQPNLTATYDQPMPALTAPLPTLSGFEFSGYFDEKTGSVMYYNAAGESARNWDKTNGQKTLYAQWAAIHTITWMVNGSQAEGNPTTSVVNGQTITTLPTTPDVDCNGKVFVGWTTAEIVGETATIPDPLYTELGDFPVVTSNMTFYAVFANGSGDERWVETDIANINSGDEVVISIMKYGNVDGLTYTYALPHNNGTTSAPAANALENIQNGVLSNAPNQDLVWTIEKDNENNLIFHPVNDGTLSLYCNKDDDGVRVGKTANALTNQKFIIYDNYLTNIATTRFVGVSFNTNTWRCYTNTTGVISDQTLKFYKKTTVYTSYTNYSTSCVAGEFDITNTDPIYVTSAVGQKIKATDTLVLTTTDMAVGTEISLSAPNITFYKEDIEITQLTTSAASETFELEIAYQPTVANTTEQPTITLEILGYKFTIDNKISCRSLPETFAIVAKVGNNWFALPSQGLNSETTPVGYPVKVDNNDNPTAVTSLPTKTEWALRNVYKVNGPYDRFAANGENLVFVNAENKTLYASKDNANIQTHAEYTNYADNNPERYEWVPTTTDLTNYTLKNVGRDKDLSINVNATFGTYATNIASNNLRFLPINATYTPFDVQVVEWYPTKVLVQTEATLASVSATVGGIAVASPSVTKKGGKLYEISGLPLESNPTKILTISYDSYSCSKVIPIIISREEKTVENAPFSTLTKDIYNYSDLVVRDGATLTINGTQQAPDKFVNVTIYPTAKIVVPENKQLSVYSLTFFGGISEIYNGSTYDINKYGVPQLSLKGTLGKTIATMDYIMRVDLDQMYQVGVPYDVNLNEITYWDGTPIELGTALYVSAYDGAARARLDWDNTWQWEVNFAEKVLKAGIGYTISAEPQVEGDTYSILRMPMKSNIISGNTETQKETIAVTAHGMSDENLTDNHKGWNYLSNPYMTSISGAESGGVNNNNIVVGYLVETGKGPWKWNNDTYRYVTIPYDDGTNYYQRKFSEATLLPFKSFFLQIANSGDLSFALASRLNAPMRHLQQQENAPREVEFELLLSNDAQSDNTGLLISEEFTPAYEINADLEKMIGTMSVYTIYNGYQLAYNALSPLNAMEEIPLGYVVPTTGEYTFNLDERGDLDDIEHIYLLDHDSSITTDLMEDIYTFTATEKKNDHRFAISVILKAEEEEETPTHLETLEWESDHPYKFIYQDKMYILRNGVIYDAMGKQVQTINK